MAQQNTATETSDVTKITGPAEDPTAWVDPEAVNQMENGTVVEASFLYEGDLYSGTGEVQDGAVNYHEAGAGRRHPETLEAVKEVQD